METVSKGRRWTGRVLSGVAVLFLLVDGLAKVLELIPEEAMRKNSLGFQASAMPTIGWTLLVCLAIHLVPRAALIGAVLLTGYLGGAIASHVRVDNPLFSHTLFPTYVAALIWGGLLLRRADVRLLLPGSAKPHREQSEERYHAPEGATIAR